VTRDVPDYALIYGSPARVHGWVCNCGEKLTFGRSGDASCGLCGRPYTRNGESVQERDLNDEPLDLARGELR